MNDHGVAEWAEELREFMAALLGVDPDPVIVFTSDVPGLVAAQAILGGDHELVICLLEEAFAHWVA